MKWQKGTWNSLQMYKEHWPGYDATMHLVCCKYSAGASVANCTHLLFFKLCKLETAGLHPLSKRHMETRRTRPEGTTLICTNTSHCHLETGLGFSHHTKCIVRSILMYSAVMFVLILQLTVWSKSAGMAGSWPQCTKMMLVSMHCHS